MMWKDLLALDHAYVGNGAYDKSDPEKYYNVSLQL